MSWQSCCLTSEDTEHRTSAGMDALTEALDALEDAAELIDEVLD